MIFPHQVFLSVGLRLHESLLCPVETYFYCSMILYGFVNYVIRTSRIVLSPPFFSLLQEASKGFNNAVNQRKSLFFANTSNKSITGHKKKRKLLIFLRLLTVFYLLFIVCFFSLTLTFVLLFINRSLTEFMKLMAVHKTIQQSRRRDWATLEGFFLDRKVITITRMSTFWLIDVEHKQYIAHLGIFYGVGALPGLTSINKGIFAMSCLQQQGMWRGSSGSPFFWRFSVFPIHVEILIISSCLVMKSVLAQ